MNSLNHISLIDKRKYLGINEVNNLGQRAMGIIIEEERIIAIMLIRELLGYLYSVHISQITRLEGDSLDFDWTNLFNSKVENYYQCVLSFHYKKLAN